MKRLRVVVLAGGPSAEHDVSILSAKNVITALDRKKYDVKEVRIPRDGHWFPTKAFAKTTDVVVPILHGTYGEDGTVQGLLKAFGIPFVGADVLGSAVGMDKDVMKRLLRDAKIPIARFLVATPEKSVSYATAKRALGATLFLKPANLGSSVGVSKAKSTLEYDAAMKHALTFDRKVIIEEFIRGREIEVAVLGNQNPEASVAGEIAPTHEFYSYEAKYLDENGAILTIPAKLPPALMKKVRAMAVRAYEVLCCEGLGRVDMFVTKSGKVYLNEINTLPGFTNISMYPKLWEASGLTQTELLDSLVALSLRRSTEQKQYRVRR